MKGVSLLVRNAACLIVLAFGWIGISQVVLADEGYEEESLYGPIQSRVYDLNHELALGWAYLPLDPYYKGYGAQLSYTIHFNHWLALELFRVGWAYNVDADLKTKLINQIPEIRPDEFPAVVFFENTNLVFKLLYGKQSLLNRSVLHFELFATTGVSFLFRNPYNIWDADFDNARYELGANIGFGFRFWLSPDWSIKVDLRDTIMLFTLNRGEFISEHSALIGLMIAVNL